MTCGKAQCKREYRRTVADPKRSATVRADYAAGRRKPARGYSDQEAVLWPHLREEGWRWRLRWTDAWGTLEIDFALADCKVAVEIDGPNHRGGKRLARDANRDAHLEALGWRVLRIPNDEVDADPQAVMRQVERFAVR